MYQTYASSLIQLVGLLDLTDQLSFRYWNVNKKQVLDESYNFPYRALIKRLRAVRPTYLCSFFMCLMLTWPPILPLHCSSLRRICVRQHVFHFFVLIFIPIWWQRQFDLHRSFVTNMIRGCSCLSLLLHFGVCVSYCKYLIANVTAWQNNFVQPTHVVAFGCLENVNISKTTNSVCCKSNTSKAFQKFASFYKLNSSSRLRGNSFLS